MTDPASQVEAAPPAERSAWRVYTGDPRVEPAPIAIPEAPPWRRFDDDAEPVAEDLAVEDADAGTTFRATPEMVDAVNAALHLRRPLLLTGRPGSGKSSLIDAVARELMLGRVLRWHVTSGSTLTDSLYRYDAIGRLHAQSLREAGSRVRGPMPPGRSPASAIRPAAAGRSAQAIEGYLRLGPLGTALLPSRRPRALLIDEIDKSDIDLPNDLLNVFERGEYTIPELARLDRETVTIRVDGGDETGPGSPRPGALPGVSVRRADQQRRARLPSRVPAPLHPAADAGPDGHAAHHHRHRASGSRRRHAGRGTHRGLRGQGEAEPGLLGRPADERTVPGRLGAGRRSPRRRCGGSGPGQGARAQEAHRRPA
jgi:hypothetical protein